MWYIFLIILFVILFKKLYDKVDKIENRLTKLEKDAVKITFNNPPYTTDDVIVDVQHKKTKK